MLDFLGIKKTYVRSCYRNGALKGHAWARTWFFVSASTVFVRAIELVKEYDDAYVADFRRVK